jgi:hypothetical protein
VIEINTIRTKTIIDLLNNNIQPVQIIDMDDTFHWQVADIHKEAIGIVDKNLIIDYIELPTEAETGTLARVDGVIYRWGSTETPT